MGNLVKTEWFKLRKDRSFRTLTGLLFAVSVLYPLTLLSGGDIAAIKVSEFYAHDVMGVNNEIIKYFPSILAGFFIAGEYSIGTMKSMVSSGSSRMRLYLAKLMVFTMGAMIISAVAPVVMTGVSAIYFGFNSMPEWVFFVQTIGLIMLYAAAFASIMATISTVFADSGKTIGFLLMFFMLFGSILFTLSAKVSFFRPIWNYSVFKWLFVIGNIQTMDGGQLFELLAVPILTYTLFGLIGSWIFQKKEIK